VPRRRDSAEQTERPTKVCEAPDCDVEFEPKRSTARFHSATCRQRAARSRKAAVEERESDDGLAEHGLVKAIRRELEEAGKLETFKGQLALQLARRMANPEESSPATLAKALDNAMAAALAKPDGDKSDPDPGAAEDDEVTKARKAREAKAAAAAEAE
jgi:hypothetical protein